VFQHIGGDNAVEAFHQFRLGTRSHQPPRPEPGWD
jgi:hypothetical protein